MTSGGQKLPLPVIGRVHVAGIFFRRISKNGTLTQQPRHKQQRLRRVSGHLRRFLSILNGIVDQAAVLLLERMTEIAIGKRTGLIRYCPDAVIEHRHYSVCPETVHDETYREAEEAHGTADLNAFQQWRADVMPYEVARLRRKYSRDVDWVLGRVA